MIETSGKFPSEFIRMMLEDKEKNKCFMSSDKWEHCEDYGCGVDSHLCEKHKKRCEYKIICGKHTKDKK